MHQACEAYFDKVDAAILAAAVADFKPKVLSDVKIKKQGFGLNIELEHTPDILSDLGKKKKGNQVLVGFALETNNELENAKIKLKNKKLKNTAI